MGSTAPNHSRDNPKDLDISFYFSDESEKCDFKLHENENFNEFGNADQIFQISGIASGSVTECYSTIDNNVVISFESDESFELKGIDLYTQIIISIRWNLIYFDHILDSSSEKTKKRVVYDAEKIIYSTPVNTQIRPPNLTLSFDLSDLLMVNEPISFAEDIICNVNTPKGIEFCSKYLSIRINVHFYPFLLSCFTDIIMSLEQTNRIVDHHLRYNGSFKSMENMSKIVNSTPNNPIKVPCTKYKIKQLIQPAIYSEYHIKCSGCLNYLPSRLNHTNCDACELDIKTSSCDYFMYIPIKQQLMQSIEQEFLISKMENCSKRYKKYIPTLLFYQL